MQATQVPEMIETQILGRAEDRRRGVDRRRQLAQQKSVAKLGMSLSLGTLVATGLTAGRGAKTLHLLSGIAMVGFSIWHYSLYQKPPRGETTNRHA
jgi:hypothetical protein